MEMKFLLDWEHVIGNLVYLHAIVTGDDLVELHIAVPTHKGKNAADFFPSMHHTSLTPVHTQIYSSHTLA